MMYDKVRETYDMRSSFVHGSGQQIKENDLKNMQDIVTSIVRRILELRNEGFDTMEKINKYVLELKFRE